jgi:hypothetical protein
MNYNEIAIETGWKPEEVARGYIVVYNDEFDVDVIQKLDDLERYGVAKFNSDTEAGRQALKDGFKLFTVDHEDLNGMYIIDTPKNRQILLEKGYPVKN